MAVQVVFLSGGKDSTAMAMRLQETDPRDGRVYVCTPTGDELPEMECHWSALEERLRAPLWRVTNGTLHSIIREQRCLPNWRMRFCTRILKIEPAQALLDALGDEAELVVGLRADEPQREGGRWPGHRHSYPLREWGWGINEVRGYLSDRGVSIPRRTDCARCFFQRLSEWWLLWKQYPHIYESAVQDEVEIGHTYRSENKDAWPGALAELRREFERGRTPRGAAQSNLFEPTWQQCRVCAG
jgi:hypothetical protein